ncbi:hypothetical protein [Tenuibacillus multivorans]|uniref:Uncharacterized protein n=1 Tax=Tenuibacillus multivorans TaxID=237069 RepID=A0A1H0A186_9BACI|nr:hypothetical protein [Tenuibacillus multivorans]GEL78359.1 hypothetical protein TMU01_25940 [Tenuibacillus multivorans]SDN27328.1 hypothetical protein SAMN05216498_1923 [Tenuibacillus multivorans]
MTRKKIYILVGIILVGVLLFGVYWFYFANPKAFLSDDKVVQELNELNDGASVETALDTMFVDEEHVVVPFVNQNNQYGLSYWVWRHHRWKPIKVDESGEPMIWRINQTDPSTYHIVWNIHPDDKLGSTKFYLLRERNYQITYGEHHYTPQIQMEKSVSIQNNPYGVMQLPNEWATIMSEIGEVNEAKQSPAFFHDMFPDPSLYIGWIPYDQNGDEKFPEHSVNGSSYHYGDINVDFVRILNEVDLERVQ